MEADEAFEKDILRHSYTKKKSKSIRKKATEKKEMILCQVADCENRIDNHKRCRIQDCIGHDMFMCTTHGPAHPLHANCKFKANSASTKTIRNKSSGLEVAMNPSSSDIISDIARLSQIDHNLLQQIVQEQVKSALLAQTNSSQSIVISSTMASSNTATRTSGRKNKNE